MNDRNIVLKEVGWPVIKVPQERHELPEYIYENRLSKIRQMMENEGVDCVAVYADREHYSNFKYFTGFEPRFEEGLLVLFKDETKQNAVLLGNECLDMSQTTSMIPLKGILCQVFSLPNQPMDRFDSMCECLSQTGLEPGMKVGVVDWKLLKIPQINNGKPVLGICSYIADAIFDIVGMENVVNATGWLIHPDYGIRVINSADDIAYLEFGAMLASEGVINLLKNVEYEMTECEAAGFMNAYGLQRSCHDMCSSGENTRKGLIGPSFKRIHKGDAFSISMGLEGGLTCRTGYLVSYKEEMPEELSDYEEKLAKPYYKAAVTWYELIGIDVTGGQIYQAVQEVFPKEKYGWKLNPGHLGATEEWLSSPIYEGSSIMIKSGMLLQMDIIPSMPPYGAANVEDGIIIADEKLRKELMEEYPDVWARIQERRNYMIDELGIKIKPEVLPLSDTCARYSPYMMNKRLAFAVE